MVEKLYCLPGTMCNERLWSKLRPLLAADLSLIHLKIPQGKNFAALNTYFNQHLHEENINLLGFSLGGYLACHLAIKNPNLVRRLFVVGNCPSPLPQHELDFRRKSLAHIKTMGYRGILHSKAVAYFDKKNQQTDLVDIVHQMDRELGAHELISQLTHTSEREDLIQCFRHFHKTTHFFCSAQDPLVDVEPLNALCLANPKISLTCLPGTGHMLPLEQPKALAASIRKWLATQ